MTSQAIMFSMDHFPRKNNVKLPWVRQCAHLHNMVNVVNVDFMKRSDVGR